MQKSLYKVMQSIQVPVKSQNKQTDTSIAARKADTRKKIMLGGLIIKAKLDYLYPEHAQILYGLLLDCKNALDSNPELPKRWKSLGQELL